MWGLRGLARVMVPALFPLLRMQQGFGGSFPGALESMSQQPGAGPGSGPPHLCVQWRCGPGQLWQGRQGLCVDSTSACWGPSQQRLRKEQADLKKRKCLMGLGSLRKWKSQRSPGARHLQVGVQLFSIRPASPLASSAPEHSSTAILGRLSRCGELVTRILCAPVLSPSGGIEGGPVCREGL